MVRSTALVKALAIGFICHAVSITIVPAHNAKLPTKSIPNHELTFDFQILPRIGSIMIIIRAF